jgi:hypothetical protein
MVFPVASIAMQ